MAVELDSFILAPLCVALAAGIIFQAARQYELKKRLNALTREHNEAKKAVRKEIESSKHTLNRVCAYYENKGAEGERELAETRDMQAKQAESISEAIREYNESMKRLAFHVREEPPEKS